MEFTGLTDGSPCSGTKQEAFDIYDTPVLKRIGVRVMLFNVTSFVSSVVNGSKGIGIISQLNIYFQKVTSETAGSLFT